MCSHFEGVSDPIRLRESFRAPWPLDAAAASGAKALRPVADLWPGYVGLFIRKPPEADSGDEAVPEREAMPGLFGLVPNWADDLKLARYTYNARTETVATKPSFRDAWRNGRHCIIPAEAIYEPDWSSGKAVPARISRADGRPMGIAGLWDRWRQADGSVVHSFTMLTINADQHPLMNRFHRPTDEKRMVVILPEAAYGDWLHASAQTRMDFMHPYPAERLVSVASPAVPRGRKTAQGMARGNDAHNASGQKHEAPVDDDVQGSLL